MRFETCDFKEIIWYVSRIQFPLQRIWLSFRCGRTFRILIWTYHVLWLVACTFGVYDDRVAYRRFSCNVSRRWWITFKHQWGGSLITWHRRLWGYFYQASSRWMSCWEYKMLVTVCVHQSYCVPRYFMMQEVGELVLWV